MKGTFRILILAVALLPATLSLKSQALPEDFTKVPLKEQMNYIEEHTKIYENFRAIREDVYQKLKRNVNDTVTFWHNQVANLKNGNADLKNRIDSLNSSLNTTKTNLEELTNSKNSIKLLGAEVDKGTYNTIMWSIVVVLILVLLIVFMVYKRNQTVIVQRNKDLQELKNEFETYRKTSREAREKMALAHFNELKKLRGE
jgi:preprotein translocase subunit SecF